jgi:hypothetical protein
LARYVKNLNLKAFGFARPSSLHTSKAANTKSSNPYSQPSKPA